MEGGERTMRKVWSVVAAGALALTFFFGIGAQGHVAVQTPAAQIACGPGGCSGGGGGG
jgi:hypothetical protein